MITSQTNVRSSRLGGGVSDGIGRESGNVVVTTVEAPWRLAQPCLVPCTDPLISCTVLTTTGFAANVAMIVGEPNRIRAATNLQDGTDLSPCLHGSRAVDQDGYINLEEFLIATNPRGLKPFCYVCLIQ